MKDRAARRKVLIRAQMRAGGLPVDVCIRDVSPQGMLLQAEAPPARGSYVEIVTAGGGVAGQITWVTERRFGIRLRDAIDVNAFASPGGSLKPAQPHSSSNPRNKRLFRDSRSQDSAQALERSRHWATVAQFTFVVAVAAIAAIAFALKLHEALSATFQSVAMRLQ
jgi:hypothetical protein